MESQPGIPPGTFEALRWWADIEPATRMRTRPSLPPSNGNCGRHAWTRTKTERLNRPPCYFDYYMAINGGWCE